MIVGEGPESERIAAEARARGVAARLLMPGFLADPARWIGHFDIFALSSDSEQFPISLVEAMAAGLPAVATAVGDVAGDRLRGQQAADRRAGRRGRLRRRARQPRRPAAPAGSAIGEANREKARR